MTIQELEKELKSNILEGIYLLYGEETFLLESSLKKMKKLFGELILGINYIQINETNVEELISDFLLKSNILYPDLINCSSIAFVSY